MRLDPVPAYVLKTKDLQNGTKVFINVCSDAQIPPPDTLDPAEVTLRAQNGQDWVVPIVVSLEKKDKDKSGARCVVYDACTNPKVVELGINDPGIKVLTHETCIELVEDSSRRLLDRNYRVPRMKFKGKLSNTEISDNDLAKPVKPLEEVLSLDVVAPADCPSASRRPLIQEVSSETAKFYLQPYRGHYTGEGEPPNLELEVPGMHEYVDFKGLIIYVDELEIHTPKPIKICDAVYVEDDDSLHVFIWLSN